MKSIKRIVPSFVFSIGIAIHLTGCFPVIQEEFISPTWKGQLISAQSLEPLANIEIQDDASGVSIHTDSEGKFVVPAQKQSLHLKVPGYVAFKDYKLNICYKTSLALSIVHEVPNTPGQEQESNLGLLLIDTQPDKAVNFSKLGLESSKTNESLKKECAEGLLSTTDRLTNGVFKAKLSLIESPSLNSDNLNAAIDNQIALINQYWEDTWYVCRPKTTQGRESLENYKELVLENLRKIAR